MSARNLMAEAIKVPDLKAEFPTFGRMARFSPGMYSIHWDNLKNIPLRLNGEPSTLDAVYVKFVNSKIRDEPDEHSGLRHKRYVTDQGDLDIEAEWTVLSTINTLAGLFKRGINPINVIWFYFDHDWSRDADECYVFFAVHDEKIVLESCHFMSSEPLILTQDKDEDPIWHSHPHFDRLSSATGIASFIRKRRTAA